MPKIKMKKIIKKYSFLIGVFIFIWIIKGLDFNQIKEAVFTINPFLYAIAVFLYIPVIMFKALRWKTIMDTQ
ncbi:MAG: lysylphosphatidylglycerol synthase domain-containing protein, partial [Patescibacteria group bacterium]